jgi:hypothetical protein
VNRAERIAATREPSGCQHGSEKSASSAASTRSAPVATSIARSSYHSSRWATNASVAPSGDHAGSLSWTPGAPVSARTSPVATSTTRISVRFRSLRGVNSKATDRRSGETAGRPSSPSRSTSSPERTSGCGQASSAATTTSLERSWRSTATISRSAPSQTGLPASTSLRGGPPAIGTSQIQP